MTLMGRYYCAFWMQVAGRYLKQTEADLREAHRRVESVDNLL